MKTRPIDAVQVLSNINWHHKPTPVSEFESGFNQGLNQAMWIITHAPTLTPQNEWVSVEERLPENSAEVLMWREKWKIAEAGTYRNACFLVYDALGDSYKADDITYWMPLPAPPKKEHDHE